MALWEALQAEFVVPLSQAQHCRWPSTPTPTRRQRSAPLASSGASPEAPIAYRFLHDRVQQAAYSLIPEAQKQQTHLKIGRLLLQHIPATERNEHIFAIANQLNYGVGLLTTEAEAYELAELNRLASHKAKAAAAYDSALRYARVGLDLLPNDSWQQQYNLTLTCTKPPPRPPTSTATLSRWKLDSGGAAADPRPHPHHEDLRGQKFRPAWPR
jgi:predicted ATPase